MSLQKCKTTPIQDVEVSLATIRTSALLRITSIIETAATLDELLMLALAEFVNMLEVEHGGILLLSEDGVTLQLVSTFPPRVTMPAPLPLNLNKTHLLDEVVRERKPVQVSNLAAQSGLAPFIGQLYEEPLHSLLLVPLVAQDSVMGMLLLATVGSEHTFGEHEVAMTRLMTGQFAAAISSFRITDAARRRNAELATLNDIAAAVTSSLDTREIYHLVVQQLNEYFRVDAGSLLMRDDETGDLEFVMTLEAGEEKLAGVRVPCGQGVVGHVAESQRYEIVLDAENDPRFYAKISEDVGYRTRSILCVPMIVKGRTIGVIELLNKYDGNFTDEDAGRLTRMAATIGVALENARLFQQVMTGRDRFEAILNSTKDGILMSDMRGLVMTANPRTGLIFNTPREELLGKHLSELLATLRERARDISVPPWINDNTDASDVFEVTLDCANNQRLFLRHSSLPVRDKSGTKIGHLTMLQDISNERELEQLREDYTGMLVHDLRAPLTAIMNGITMVRHGLGGPVSEQQDQLLAISYNSSQTMLEMVNTLLDISKMEQGRMSLSLDTVSPYVLVNDTVSRLQASAQGQQVMLNPQMLDGLPLLNADSEKVVRVLQNLLDNAIKFSPAGSEVTVGVAYRCIGVEHMVTNNGDGIEEIDDGLQNGLTFHHAVALPVTLPELADGEWLIFWVRDHGPGIPRQYHDRIFEKFGQVRGRKVRGTGLGLTFSKLVVESHGGHIWLESVEGEGSTFALALPVVNRQVEEVER